MLLVIACLFFLFFWPESRRDRHRKRCVHDRKLNDRSTFCTRVRQLLLAMAEGSFFFAFFSQSSRGVDSRPAWLHRCRRQRPPRNGARSVTIWSISETPSDRASPVRFPAALLGWKVEERFSSVKLEAAKYAVLHVLQTLTLWLKCLFMSRFFFAILGGFRVVKSATTTIITTTTCLHRQTKCIILYYVMWKYIKYKQRASHQAYAQTFYANLFAKLAKFLNTMRSKCGDVWDRRAYKGNS